jgi:hypothetical protein
MFANDLNLWNEEILLGSERLILSNPPNEKVFSEKVQALRERTRKVRAINDFFTKL